MKKNGFFFEKLIRESILIGEDVAHYLRDGGFHDDAAQVSDQISDFFGLSGKFPVGGDSEFDDGSGSPAKVVNPPSLPVQSDGWFHLTSDHVVEGPTVRPILNGTCRSHCYEFMWEWKFLGENGWGESHYLRTFDAAYDGTISMPNDGTLVAIRAFQQDERNHHNAQVSDEWTQENPPWRYFFSGTPDSTYAAYPLGPATGKGQDSDDQESASFRSAGGNWAFFSAWVPKKHIIHPNLKARVEIFKTDSDGFIWDPEPWDTFDGLSAQFRDSDYPILANTEPYFFPNEDGVYYWGVATTFAEDFSDPSQVERSSLIRFNVLERPFVEGDLPGDLLGRAVAIDHGTIVASAHGAAKDTESGTVADSGIVKVIGRIGGEWAEQQVLENPTDVSANFGIDVEIQGDRMVVGAQGADTAYVYTRSLDNTWEEEQELSAFQVASGDKFGSSVDIDGGTIVVGAIYDNVGNLTEQGAAYVFSRVDGDWVQLGDNQLKPANELTFKIRQFGAEVAVDEEYIFVGDPAYGNTPEHPSRMGTVVPYRMQGSAIFRDAQFDQGFPEFVPGETNFGESLSLGRGRLFIGAPAYSSILHGTTYTGEVYELTRGLATRRNGVLTVPNRRVVNNGSGFTSVYIDTGGGWILDSAVQLPNWISVDPELGDGPQIVTISYLENVGESERNGLVQFKSTSALAYPETDQFVLVQTTDAPAEFLSIAPNGHGAAKSAGSTLVEITTSNSWSAVSSDSWLTVTPSSGNGNEVVEVEFTENTGGQVRDGTITVLGTSTLPSSEQFTVVQNDKEWDWVLNDSSEIEVLFPNDIGSDVGDAFGMSVDHNGDTLIIGAPNRGRAGGVYVYSLRNGAWEFRNLITPDSNFSDGAGFGHSVALSGSTLVVGAPSHTPLAGSPDFGRIDIQELDLEPPAAYAIVPQTTIDTNLTQVAFTVIFDEKVRFFGESDLTVSTTGTVTYNATNSPIVVDNYIDGSQNPDHEDRVWTVRITGVSGIGSLSLEIAENADIEDFSGNPLVGSARGTVYMDSIAPSISNVEVEPASALPGQDVLVSFSTDEVLHELPLVQVDGFDASNCFIENIVTGEEAQVTQVDYCYRYRVPDYESPGDAFVAITAEDIASNSTVHNGTSFEVIYPTGIQSHAETLRNAYFDGLDFDDAQAIIPSLTEYQFNNMDIISDGILTMSELLSKSIGSVGTMSIVFVDFNYEGDEYGTSSQPFDTLFEAAEYVSAGGDVLVRPGESAEAVILNKAMYVVSARNVSVRIGESN